MRVAAIDLGSNSFLCLICEIENGIIKSTISDTTKVVRLSEKLNSTGILSDTALKRAEETLDLFAGQIARHKPEAVFAVATAAARTAKNSDRLLALCKERKIPLKIIEGTEEARLSFGGTLSSKTNAGHYIVIDIGGASTEIIYGTKIAPVFAKSLPMGVVKLTEAFLKGGDETRGRAEMEKYILNELEGSIEELAGRKITEVIAVAGTPTTLAAIEVGGYSVERVDNFQFTRARIREWRDTLGQLTAEQIVLDYGVDPGRADVIYTGAFLLEKILQVLQQESLCVSTRGLRYGVALAVERGDFFGDAV